MPYISDKLTIQAPIEDVKSFRLVCKSFAASSPDTSSAVLSVRGHTLDTKIGFLESIVANEDTPARTFTQKLVIKCKSQPMKIEGGWLPELELRLKACLRPAIQCLKNVTQLK